MTAHFDDHERVRELLGREPRGRYEVVVRDADGDPVVLRNDPLLDDGTPMPTRFWLLGARESKRIGQLEAAGGVNAAEAAVDPDELAAAHVRYAAERDAALPARHRGPVPTGGVGGTRVGVKCLHAHWAWHLAGGDDPVGRWIEQQFRVHEREALTCSIAVTDDVTVIRFDETVHEIPWGAANLTFRWLSDDDPPRPDALTNALGTITDHLDDLARIRPDVTEAVDWAFLGPTITSIASLEAGAPVGPSDVDYSRTAAEEVFRLVATESKHDRAANPGLPSHHVDQIVATSCIIQACMRRFHLGRVTLRVSG